MSTFSSVGFTGEREGATASKKFRLPILFSNIRSVRNKSDELDFELSFYDSSNLPIVLLTESWLCADDLNTIISSRYCDFTICRSDRKNRVGGGVLAMVPSYLPLVFSANSIHSSNSFEGLWFDLPTYGHSIRVVIIYRSPSYLGLPSELLSYLELALDVAFPVVVFGDFNFPHINWEAYSPTAGSSHATNVFLQGILQLGMEQLVHHSTRGDNILDLILSTHPNVVQGVQILPPIPTCDHNKITGYLVMENETHNSSSITRRQFHKADYASMSQALGVIDWQILFSGIFDINDLWLLLKSILNQLIQVYVPLCGFLEVRHKSHWPKPVRKLHRRQIDLYHKYKATKSAVVYQSYLTAAKLSRKAKRDLLNAKEFKILESKNPKVFYSYVNKKMGCKSSIPSLESHLDKPIFDDFEKAELLNTFFASVFVEDDGQNQTLQLDRFDHLPNEIFFSFDDVFMSLHNLPSKISSGPDNFPALFMKKLALYLAEPLAYIFNFSFVLGRLPDEWKFANITPIYKNKGSRSSTTNYRPISLTCVCCKVMEDIVVKRLSTAFLHVPIISSSQHGFVRKRSTVTQLLECFNDWTDRFERGEAVDVIYLDIAKAFDSVCHKKLILKLGAYGFGGHLLAWLTDFLQNRFQRVRVNGEFSSWLPVTSGVPQGSKLGPLLFLIYINDLSNSVQNSVIKLFADDCKLYFSCSSPFNFDPLEEDLSRVSLWTETNQLQLALQKSVALHIGTNNPNHSYNINEILIPQDETVNDLGILVAKNLKFNNHYDKIIKSGFVVSSRIFNSFVLRTKSFLCKMFKTYVRPKLEYGSEVWNPSYITHVENIERVQRSFTKRIPGLQNLSYEQRLKHLNLLSLADRRKMFDLLMVYKILNG
ncbi:MAG: hypothetical protein GY820_06775, partial [Gammaproteobacteria bacterium]|nr:hypothetical protein [Gammaproteobacteria bacterium]